MSIALSPSVPTPRGHFALALFTRLLSGLPSEGSRPLPFFAARPGLSLRAIIPRPPSTVKQLSLPQAPFPASSNSRPVFPLIGLGAAQGQDGQPSPWSGKGRTRDKV